MRYDAHNESTYGHQVDLIWRLWFCVIVAISASACRMGASHGAATTKAPSPGLRVTDRRDAITVDEGTQNTLRKQGLDNSVLTLLLDDVLSFEDYQQAFFEFVQCTEDHGWEVSTGYPRLAPWGAYQVHFSPYSTKTMESLGATSDDVFQWLDECGQAYWTGIDRLWGPLHEATEQEEQTARDAVAACLQSQDIDIEDHPTADFLAARMFEESQGGPELDDWVACLKDAELRYFTSGTGVEFAG